jgi:hypothetical protein
LGAERQAVGGTPPAIESVPVARSSAPLRTKDGRDKIYFKNIEKLTGKTFVS